MRVTEQFFQNTQFVLHVIVKFTFISAVYLQTQMENNAHRPINCFPILAGSRVCLIFLYLNRRGFASKTDNIKQIQNVPTFGSLSP